MPRTDTPTMHARDAYDAIAPAYDLLTGGYAHDRWLAALETLAIKCGLRGRRLLDVACGTGKSFLPMLARGYDVTACDISDGMLDRARRKVPGAELYLADMRELPAWGAFDLVTCIDDSLNYLLTEDELTATLEGLARNLGPGGIALWDLNTIAQYRDQFAGDHLFAGDGLVVDWLAPGANARFEPGGLAEVTIEVSARRDDGSWNRSSAVHRQRHWPRATIERVARAAGLRLLDVRGQYPGAVINGELNELAHAKAVYVACDE